MGERVVLNELGRVKLSDFRNMIRESRKSGKPMITNFNLCGLSYRAIFAPDKMILYLNWKRNGDEYVEKIRLSEAKSNLNLNPVLYFICPHSGRRCRKLFTDGFKFFSMKALSRGFTYSERNESKRYRGLSKVMKEPPSTSKRKMYYRGRLTPFGRKMEKYWSQDPEEIEAVFANLHRKRGRPMGSRGIKSSLPPKSVYTPKLFE